MKHINNPFKNIVESYLPIFIIITLLYLFRKQIFAGFVKNITGKDIDEYKKDIETIRKASPKELIGAFKYMIKEPQFKSAEYFKNKQWEMDLTRGFKTKEQVLLEIKNTGYAVSKKVARLLK